MTAEDTLSSCPARGTGRVVRTMYVGGPTPLNFSLVERCENGIGLDSAISINEMSETSEGQTLTRRRGGRNTVR